MTVMTDEERAEFREHLRKRREILRTSKEEARKLLMHVGILTSDRKLAWWFKELYGLDKSYDDVRY